MLPCFLLSSLGNVVDLDFLPVHFSQQKIVQFSMVLFLIELVGANHIKILS